MQISRRQLRFPELCNTGTNFLENSSNFGWSFQLTLVKTFSQIFFLHLHLLTLTHRIPGTGVSSRNARATNAAESDVVPEDTNTNERAVNMGYIQAMCARSTAASEEQDTKSHFKRDPFVPARLMSCQNKSPNQWISFLSLSKQVDMQGLFRWHSLWMVHSSSKLKLIIVLIIEGGTISSREARRL